MPWQQPAATTKMKFLQKINASVAKYTSLRASWVLWKNPAFFARCAAENPRIFFMAKRQSPLDAGLCPFPLPHFFSVHLRVSYQTRKKWNTEYISFPNPRPINFMLFFEYTVSWKIREARAKKDPVQHRKRYEKSSRTVSYRAAAGCAELPPVGSGNFVAEASRIFQDFCV